MRGNEGVSLHAATCRTSLCPNLAAVNRRTATVGAVVVDLRRAGAVMLDRPALSMLLEQLRLAGRVHGGVSSMVYCCNVHVVPVLENQWVQKAAECFMAISSCHIKTLLRHSSVKKKGGNVRITLFAAFALLSSVTHAVDAYQWCQANIDNVRELTSYPLENLSAYRRLLANASTVEELEELTGKKYTELVLIVQQHQGVGREEAEQKALELGKATEIQILGVAIRLHGVSDEQTWSLLFDKCVQENQ